MGPLGGGCWMGGPSPCGWPVGCGRVWVWVWVWVWGGPANRLAAACRRSVLTFSDLYPHTDGLRKAAAGHISRSALNAANKDGSIDRLKLVADYIADLTGGEFELGWLVNTVDPFSRLVVHGLLHCPGVASSPAAEYCYSTCPAGGKKMLPLDKSPKQTKVAKLPLKPGSVGGAAHDGGRCGGECSFFSLG